MIELLQQIEKEIVDNIISLLNKGSASSALWQAERLRDLGLLNQKNKKVIIKYLPKIIKEFNKTNSSAAIKTLKELSLLLESEQEIDKSIEDLLKTFDQNIKTQIMTLGNMMIKQARDLYMSIVLKTMAETVTGVKTLRSAIADIATETLSNGIPAFVDRAGKKWSIEGYAQMLSRTTIRQITTDVSFKTFDNNNIDLIEISSHLGARPLCAPYQGRVYSRSGNDPIYPPFSSTSYGQPAGLFGINCTHRMYPFQRGMKKTYHPYPEKLNDKAYELSQKQRYYERSIRDAKKSLREAEKLNNNENIIKEKINLNKKQKLMRDFISATNRARRYDRETIY